MGSCDGCGGETEVAPFAKVFLCFRCFVFAAWLDEDVKAELHEHFEGQTS